MRTAKRKPAIKLRYVIRKYDLNTGARCSRLSTTYTNNLESAYANFLRMQEEEGFAYDVYDTESNEVRYTTYP